MSRQHKVAQTVTKLAHTFRLTQKGQICHLINPNVILYNETGRKFF
jgi:hypothetical protein